MAGALDKLNTLVGNPKKALLVLHSTPQLRAAAGSISIKKDKFEQVVLDTHKVLNAAAQGTTEEGLGDYILEVQYNPASLNLTASAESMPIRPLQPAFDQNVPLSASVPPSVIMMVELIFDDIVVPDAFLFDKFNISAGNVVNDVLLATDTRPHTVQPQTNGLLAAMQRTDTRRISFYWADMSFHGDIRDMQAKYTMFSVSGRPIRSVMNFTIVQTPPDKGMDLNAGYWRDALTSVFGRDDNSDNPEDKTYNSRTMAQKLGTWINIY